MDNAARNVLSQIASRRERDAFRPIDTRECLGGLVERSITADVLIDELDGLAAHRGYPRCAAL